MARRGACGGGVLAVAVVLAFVGCGAFSGKEDPSPADPGPSGDAGGVLPPAPDGGGADLDGGADGALPDGGDPDVGPNETLVQAFRFDLTCAALEKVQNVSVTLVPGKVGNGCRVCLDAVGADTTAIVRASFGASRAGNYHARLWGRQAPAPATPFMGGTVTLGDGAAVPGEKPLALSAAWAVSSVDATLKSVTGGFVELRFNAAGATVPPCADVDTIVVTMDR